MKTPVAPRRATRGICLLASSLTACPDPGIPADTGDSEAQTTTTGTTTSTTSTPTSTGVPTSTDVSTSTTSADPTTTTDDTTTGGIDACATLLCGDPSTCCGADEECLAGACAPTCASGVRCGNGQELCCDQGDVCLADVCTAPGAACTDKGDCAEGETCDPDLGSCLPQPDILTCQAIPAFDAVDVALEWAHTADQVIATPMVVDLDGDGAPELVVNTMRQTGLDADYPKGELICLDGATGTLEWRIPHDPNQSKFGAHGRATIAVGDVSGDGKPDIVYAGRQKADLPPSTRLSPVHAVDGDGNFLWTARTMQNTIAEIRIENGAAALANLDSDPMAEIAFGAAIFDHDGLMVVNQGGSGGMVGTPHAPNMPTSYLYPGGISTFVDLDDDGELELATGREAWEIDWVVATPPQVTLTQKWKATSGAAGDGYVAIADLDLNGTPEVVLTAWPEIKILDGATGKLWCGVDSTGAMCDDDDALRTQPIQVPGGNLGGPATIADFDGDARPELGIATGASYRVFDLNRPGEVIVKPVDDPMPALGAIYTRWAQPTQDASSAATGSSVFDLQGDGIAEVAYLDECHAYLYDGATGDVRLALANSSATIHEYPVIADVDGDGAAELIVVANHSDANANANCVADEPAWLKRKGIYVYGAVGAGWAPTRKLWTQHTYHVTNAESDGNVPLSEQANWTSPGLNDFRRNVQGEGSFPAVDLSISLAALQTMCADKLVLRATIYNEGALTAPAGIDVTFYDGTDDSGLLLTTAPTTDPLLSGASTIVTVEVDAPPAGETRDYFAEVDGGPDGGDILECDESNNDAIVTAVGCPT
jgi:hypothetical protein